MGNSPPALSGNFSVFGTENKATRSIRSAINKFQRDYQAPENVGTSIIEQRGNVQDKNLSHLLELLPLESNDSFFVGVKKERYVQSKKFVIISPGLDSNVPAQLYLDLIIGGYQPIVLNVNGIHSFHDFSILDRVINMVLMNYDVESISLMGISLGSLTILSYLINQMGEYRYPFQTTGSVKKRNFYEEKLFSDLNPEYPRKQLINGAVFISGFVDINFNQYNSETLYRIFNIFKRRLAAVNPEHPALNASNTHEMVQRILSSEEMINITSVSYADKLKLVPVPFVFIHSADDTLSNWKQIEKAVFDTNGCLVLSPGGGHVVMLDRDDLSASSMIAVQTLDVFQN